MRATTCHIDSDKVSNSKLKLYLCNCVKIEIIESAAPPQETVLVRRNVNGSDEGCYEMVQTQHY